jgi:hypothetical protein
VIEVSGELPSTHPSYYGLNMKCPPQVHVLNVWSLASGTILRSSRKFRR